MRRKIICTALMLCILAAITAMPFAGADIYAPRMEISGTPVFEVYWEAPASQSVYYGAKFEPRAGIYAGTPADRRIAGFTNAVSSRYVDFNSREEFDLYHWEGVGKSHFDEVGVEKLHVVNWNFHGGSSSLTPAAYDDYIRRNIDKMGNSGWDILLVFGKEFDIDGNFSDPAQFIDMFRHVAQYAHTKSNIAMVWSPNALSGFDMNLDWFWPGGEYVDWIGTSLYIDPHFLGDPAQDNLYNQDRLFFTGGYASTVTRMRLLADYALKQSKPMIVTEGGIAHYSNRTRTDHRDWALPQIYDMYAVIPRLFPNVKIAINFNYYNPNGSDYYRYDIGTIPNLSTALVDALRDPVYLSHYGSQASVSYQTFNEGPLTQDVRLSAVTYQPGDLNATVRYIVDGGEVHEATRPPFNHTLRQNARTLTVQMVSRGSVVAEKHYTFATPVTPPPPSEISVFLNGVKMEFEVPPQIINGRTMVPLRAIFEAMGVDSADIKWDDPTQTVTAVKGATTVILTIGSTSPTINGVVRPIDQPAEIINNRTLAPLRFVAEAFGGSVDWDDATRTAYIIT